MVYNTHKFVLNVIFSKALLYSYHDFFEWEWTICFFQIYGLFIYTENLLLMASLNVKRKTFQIFLL